MTVGGGASNRATEQNHVPAPKATTVTNRRGSDRASKNREPGINPAPPLHIQSFFVATLLPNLNDMLAAARSRTGKWQKYDTEKALYQSMIRADIKVAKLTPMTRVHVSFLWHERNRKRDKDNIAAACKFIFDALVEQQILANDGWDEIASFHHAFVVCPQQPGCLVTLEEVCSTGWAGDDLSALIKDVRKTRSQTSF